jgi:hypothetical protein
MPVSTDDQDARGHHHWPLGGRARTIDKGCDGKPRNSIDARTPSQLGEGLDE